MDKIVLFGVGTAGKRVYEFLQYKGMEDAVECFCDNNTDLSGKQIGNKKVYPYESCRSKKKNFVITTVNEKYKGN